MEGTSPHIEEGRNSGEQIIMAIAKQHQVKIDNDAKAKLQEFAIKYAADILEEAKKYSICSKRETITPEDVRYQRKYKKS